jgi:hypothetical protein
MELTLCNSIDVITNILDRGIYKSLFCMGRWMRISYFQVPPSVALEKSTKPKMTTNGMKSCNLACIENFRWVKFDTYYLTPSALQACQSMPFRFFFKEVERNRSERLKLRVALER